MKNISSWLVALAFFATLNLHAQERTLSLEEALTIAKEHNKRIKIEKLAAKAMHEETRISKASLMPAVSASGGYSYYIGKPVIFMPGAFTGNEAEPVVDVAVGGKNTFNASLSITQPLLSQSGRRQIKAAKISESIQDLHLLEESADLSLTVADTYYRALVIQESIELNKQSLSRNLKSLDDSRELFMQGKSLKVDTLRNFIIVENLKTTLTYQENQRHIVMLELQQLLGTNRNETIILTDSLRDKIETHYLTVLEPGASDGIQSRPDILIQKLNIEMSQNNVRLSRAQRLPIISLVGAYQIQAQADDRRFAAYRWPKTSFLGVHAHVPLFSGSKTNSRIRQAQMQLESSRLQMEDAVDHADTEVRTLKNNLKELVQRLSTQERTVDAAEMNFKIVNDRYKNGLSSRLELSDAELSLTQAKMNRLQNIFEVKTTKLHLDKALGILR